jgi:CheY-like chemotaxis protein
MSIHRHTGALKILLVEDYPDGAESTAVLLRFAGYDVRVATDGLAGLAAIEESWPDALILDIGLPGLNGFEVAKQIREKHGTALPIIAISGYCQRKDLEQSRDAGIDYHWAKPADPDRLLKLLAMVAKRD